MSLCLPFIEVVSVSLYSFLIIYYYFEPYYDSEITIIVTLVTTDVYWRSEPKR